MNKKVWATFNLLFMASAAGLIIWSFRDTSRMADLYRFTSYYIILALFLFWISSWKTWLNDRKYNTISFLKLEWRGLLFCVLIAAAVFISVKPFFRVLADETNLLAVSKSMTFDQTIDNSTMGKWYYGNYYPVASEPPTRPLLHPFFTSLIHSISGYSANNPFAANFIFLTAFFFLIYIIFSREYGSVWGIIAVLSVCAQPVLIQAATSGGFDLLNLLFIFIFFFFLRDFLRAPSAASLTILLSTGLMFSHVRYESMLFFGLTVFVLLIIKKLKWEYLQSSLIYGLSPIFCLPLFWGRRIHLAMNDPFQSGTISEGFGLAPFKTNLHAFLSGFFRFDHQLPYAVILNWLGAVALVYLTFEHFLKPGWPSRKEDKSLFRISLLFVFAYLALMLVWFAGWPKHPSNARYFILYASAFSLLAVIGAQKVRLFNTKPIIPLLFVLGTLNIYHGRSVENRFTLSQTLPREYYQTLEYIKKQNTQHILIIADRPGMYTAHNFGAISFDYANKYPKKTLSDLGRRLVENIFVIQEIEFKTGLPVKQMTLDPQFNLESVYEFQNTAEIVIRISKVKL